MWRWGRECGECYLEWVCDSMYCFQTEGSANVKFAKASKPTESNETTMQKALTSTSRTKRHQPLRLQAASWQSRSSEYLRILANSSTPHMLHVFSCPNLTSAGCPGPKEIHRLWHLAPQGTSAIATGRSTNCKVDVLYHLIQPAKLSFRFTHADLCWSLGCRAPG